MPTGKLQATTMRSRGWDYGNLGREALYPTGVFGTYGREYKKLRHRLASQQRNSRHRTSRQKNSRQMLCLLLSFANFSRPFRLTEHGLEIDPVRILRNQSTILKWRACTSTFDRGYSGSVRHFITSTLSHCSFPLPVDIVFCSDSCIRFDNICPQNYFLASQRQSH